LLYDERITNIMGEAGYDTILEGKWKLTLHD
jgi:hypothetical protein